MCHLMEHLMQMGFPKGKVGTKYKVHLPDIYSETPGTPVDASSSGYSI
jgi:hypothetical protein